MELLGYKSVNMGVAQARPDQGPFPDLGLSLHSSLIRLALTHFQISPW